MYADDIWACTKYLGIAVLEKQAGIWGGRCESPVCLGHITIGGLGSSAVLLI